MVKRMDNKKLTDGEVKILALKRVIDDSFNDNEVKSMLVGLLGLLFLDDNKEIISYLQEMRNKFDSMNGGE